MPTPAALLALARNIAVRAAEFALAARRVGVEVAATKSTPTDIVTATDRDTEALIRSLILAARPDDGIVGEEDTAHIGTSGLNWVVDPIDGTVNFLYGIPAWAVSIAVVEGAPEPGQLDGARRRRREPGDRRGLRGDRRGRGAPRRRSNCR